MTEDTKEGAAKDKLPETKETPANDQATDSPIVKFAGKEFDVSTAQGRNHLEAWMAGFSSAHGRQANELGSLRAFKQQMAPSEAEGDLLANVAKLREEGENQKADELMFGYTKQSHQKLQETFQIERENDGLWNDYFGARPKLLESYDRDEVRMISERKLGDRLYGEDPFSALDSYWNGRIERSQALKDAKPIDTSPTVVQGGSAPESAPTKTSDKPAETGFDVLKSVSVFTKNNK